MESLVDLGRLDERGRGVDGTREGEVLSCGPGVVLVVQIEWFYVAV